MPVLDAAVTATIGGVNAPVTCAGPFDGGMLGVLEVTLTVPSHTTSAKGVAVVVTIGGNAARRGADRHAAINTNRKRPMRGGRTVILKVPPMNTRAKYLVVVTSTLLVLLLLLGAAMGKGTAPEGPIAI